MADMLAPTPDPPYVAVIFTTLRSDDQSGYGEMADEMERLASKQAGYLGIESTGSSFGITVSYWATETDARSWKTVAEHLAAQRLGRERWYRDYAVRVATVTREYRHPGAANDGAGRTHG